MTWQEYISDFKAYLQLERSLSGNTISAYCSDVSLFEKTVGDKLPHQITTAEIESFLAYLYKEGGRKTTQARKISALREFFKFVEAQKNATSDPDFAGWHNPMQGIDTPKDTRRLPDVLSLEEIEKILQSFNLTTPEGIRNRAIIEMLYGCGLRVHDFIGYNSPTPEALRLVLPELLSRGYHFVTVGELVDGESGGALGGTS